MPGIEHEDQPQETKPVQEPAQWEFKPEGEVPVNSDSPQVPRGQEIAWTASEFIAHDKNVGWYFLIVISGVAIAALTYFVTGRNDIIAPVLVVIATIIFAMYAARKPRELEYELNEKGLQIGDKLYSYASFRSFSVIQEDGIESIWFLPLKRFSPGLTIYFAPDDKDKILNVLSPYLPVEPRQLDPIDKLLHKIHF